MIRVQEAGSTVIQKTYDRDYFEKWYRDPKHAVTSAPTLRRKVALAVATA